MTEEAIQMDSRNESAAVNVVAEDPNTDYTSNVADEMLCEVFSYVSLRDKMRLAAVSKRFRKIILKQVFRKPMRLELNLNEQTLNGCKVSLNRWRSALKCLTHRTKLKAIIFTEMDSIKKPWCHVLTSVVSILANSNCLEEVTTFEASVLDSEDPFAFWKMLEKLLAKCVKLTKAVLNFELFPSDFKSILGDKPLTDLTIRMNGGYGPEQILAFFRAIKPNMLQKISLSASYAQGEVLAKLIDKLANGNALAALRVAHFDMDYSSFLSNPVFTSLSRLPSLNHCSLELLGTAPGQSLGDVIQALFNTVDLSKALTIEFVGADKFQYPGCRVMNELLQLRNRHQGMQISFVGGRIKFELRAVSVLTCVNATECGDACVQCKSFYPNVLKSLSTAADGGQSVQVVDGYQLDRCRIGSIVEHLNSIGDGDRAWRAVSVNYEQAHNCVLIFFEMIDGGAQCYVAMQCAPCFVGGCVACVTGAD